MPAPSTPTATPGSPKARLLIVSATYVTEENRKKLAALARHFDVTCATCDKLTAYGLLNRIDPTQPPDGYRLIGLPAVGDPKSTTRYWLRGLGRVFRRSHPDVVLVESEPWAWIRWQSWLGKTWWCRRAIFGEFSWENLERPGRKGIILSLVYRAANFTNDFVVAGNHAAKAIFVRHGKSPARVLVSPQLGVDPALFHPVARPARDQLRREIGVPPDALLIGFCGRLVESKGLRDLIDSVRRVRARLPASKVHLALLGFGPMKEELSALAETEKFLHVFPPRYHAQIAPYMQALDLFVLPSKPEQGGEVWAEQFGFVLIQAMACGVATIGSDCGAIPEVIDVPEAIFPAGDTPSLADKLAVFIEQPALRDGVADRQRRQTLERYANDNLGVIWADFIRQFLPPRASNPR